MAKRYTQPQSGPATANPAWQVAHLWSPNIGGRMALRDCAGNGHGVFGAASSGTEPSGVRWMVGPTGQYLLADNSDTGTVASTDILIGDASGSAGPVGNKFTIACRIRSGGAATQTIYSSASSDGVDFRLSGTNTLQLLKAGVALIGESTGSLTVGVDYDIAVVYDGTTVFFYINGVLDSSASSAQTFNHAQQYNIGVFNLERWANGTRLYQLAVFNRVLSGFEAKALTGQGFWQLFAPTRTVLKASAGGGVSASVTATDGADSLAASASVIVSASSATTDGADVLAANVTPQAATTSVSVATTDGADVLVSSISVISTASSATTDGADTLAATVAPSGTAISSNTTDGADVLAAAVGPQVAAASATADGMDVLAASAGPIVGVASATVDGADTLAGNIAPVQSVAISAAIADGADVLAAVVGTQAEPQPYYIGGIVQKKYRYRYSEDLEKKLDALEPAIALAVQERAQQYSQKTVAAALDRAGTAYQARYEALYRELIAEMQQDEDEQIMRIVASLL